MVKMKNTLRQFAGFFDSQRNKNDREQCSASSHQEARSTTGEDNLVEHMPVGVDTPSLNGILNCPLNDAGNCQVYGTPCQYLNRLNCADYHEYRRRR